MSPTFRYLVFGVLFLFAGCISDPAEIQSSQNQGESDATEDTSQDSDACEPVTCDDFDCGTPDNCGEPLDCGTCPDNGTICTEDNQCVCTRPSRAEICEDAECGTVKVRDSCGDEVVANCDNLCEEFETCGENNSCQDCEPIDCQHLNASCGVYDDGCGEEIYCGDASDEDDGCDTDNDEVCAYKSGAYRCSDTCEPQTCNDIGATCGEHADGCGVTLDCGTCDGPGEWVNDGTAYPCCDTSGERCQCQDQIFLEPTCEDNLTCGEIQTDTRTVESGCNSCGLTQSCRDGACRIL